MPTFYTVAQCVPDPVADERINFGVIVYGDGQIRSRFVKNWTRIKQFGIKDTRFLRDFVSRIEAAEAGQETLPAVPGLQRFDEAALERIIGNWASGIQFTEPRGSLRDPDVVLDDAAARFLRDAADPQRRHRSRARAAEIAENTVVELLTQRAGREAVEHLLHRRPDIAGRLEEHKIDVAVANGRWRFAVHGLSFELDDAERLEQQYTNVVYAISDIRNRIRDLPIGLLVLPPRADSGPEAGGLYERAERVFPKAGATILTEDSAGLWVRDQIDQLPPDDLARRSKTAAQPDGEEEFTLFPLAELGKPNVMRRRG